MYFCIFARIEGSRKEREGRTLLVRSFVLRAFVLCDVMRGVGVNERIADGRREGREGREEGRGWEEEEQARESPVLSLLRRVRK